MPFQLLDSLSLPGNSAKPNEDAFAIGERFATVFDGATGLGENLLPGPSDAQWIARFGVRRLAAHAEAGEGTPREWLRRAAADAAKSYVGLRRRAPSSKYEIPYASMIALVLKNEAVEALWFGDCAALVRAADGTVSIIGDTVQARLRERERARNASRNKAPAAAGVRAEFLPALRTARNLVNTGGGGWLFAPDAACADHAASARITTLHGATLLLASDGFLALVSDYERYDIKTLLAAAEGKGLGKLGEELRQIEAGDPEGTGFPRFKKSDDATAVLLRIA